MAKNLDSAVLAENEELSPLQQTLLAYLGDLDQSEITLGTLAEEDSALYRNARTGGPEALKKYYRLMADNFS